MAQSGDLWHSLPLNRSGRCREENFDKIWREGWGGKEKDFFIFRWSVPVPLEFSNDPKRVCVCTLCDIVDWMVVKYIRSGRFWISSPFSRPNSIVVYLCAWWRVGGKWKKNLFCWSSSGARWLLITWSERWERHREKDDENLEKSPKRDREKDPLIKNEFLPGPYFLFEKGNENLVHTHTHTRDDCQTYISTINLLLPVRNKECVLIKDVLFPLPSPRIQNSRERRRESVVTNLFIDERYTTTTVPYFKH